MQDLPRETTTDIEKLLQNPLNKCDNAHLEAPHRNIYWDAERVTRLKLSLRMMGLFVLGEFKDPFTKATYLSIFNGKSSQCVIALVENQLEGCAYSACLKLPKVPEQRVLSMLESYFSMLDGA